MCLLIASPNGSIPSLESQLESYISNPDGFGIAYVDIKYRLKVFKGLFEPEDISQLLTLAEGRPYIAHWRWASHGTTSRANCHPYHVRSGLVMAHNGVIKTPIERESRSDTWHYVKNVVRPALGGKRTPEDIRPMLEKTSKGSKLAFLSERGDITIIHESSGHWNGGVWYSNESYQPSRYSAWDIDDIPFAWECCDICGSEMDADDSGSIDGYRACGDCVFVYQEGLEL